MEYSIDNWVEDGPEDRQEFRQAVHIILQAISSSTYLKPKMIMKGGMLLGIRYQSSRFTEDIDFSTAEKLADIDQDEFESELNEALQIAEDELAYPIKCVVQTLKIQPKGGEATFPSFNLKIGYANRQNAGAIKRLQNGQSPKTVKIDYSFNEMTYKTDEIKLEDEESVMTYGITDLLAEKIRSIIQQPYRERNRRQDIYDLHYLLSTIEPLSSEEKLNTLDTLIKKSKGRVPLKDITHETLDRDDIRTMSHSNYHLLAKEVRGDLPDFDVAYDLVVDFYKSLPWDCISIESE
ncbi:nucleotidyl transferase AbiEii/AbiGii toxin family protein [Vibrio fortis]|uniref:nucleotidyl transferase AbiEii/AbiGii toxin family protein n=1 Tax=Vibrio fortis TaxID=212667 RepID=UPI0038CD748C